MGEPFDRFLQLLFVVFIRPTILVISVLHLTRFTSQVTELLLRNRASVIYAEFFRATVWKNYALDRKMIVTFLMDSTCSITMQRLEEVGL